MITFFSVLTVAGISVTGFGIWVALHLKCLSPIPIWMGVIVTAALTLKVAHLLGEVIYERRHHA